MANFMVGDVGSTQGKKKKHDGTLGGNSTAVRSDKFMKGGDLPRLLPTGFNTSQHDDGVAAETGR